MGRMTLQEAYNLNLHISILDPSENAPCKPLTDDFVQGDFKDFDTVYQFGKDKHLMTIEFEDVNADALKKLEKEGVKVYPQPHILKLIQDKGLQKQFYQDHGLPTSPFELIKDKSEIANSKLDFPLFQKLRTSGYDGYGVQKLKSKESAEQAMDGPSVLEEGVDLQTELSVVIARNESGEIKHFPLVELAFNPKANMVEFLFSPASVSQEIEEQTYALATKLMDKLGMVGLLAVEMFLSKDGELMINEIAPRAHNSGHHSIEGNYTSQFGQHLRAILNLPLGNTNIRNAAVMVNLLGEEGHTGEAIYQGMEDVLKLEGVYPHLYGKSQVKPYRKMGHITVIDEEVEKAKTKARKVKEMVKVVAKESL